MGRRKNCRNECGRQSDKKMRGLCRPCYYTPGVRELYPPTGRGQTTWLKRELVRLRELRLSEVSIPECAAILGRSEDSVRSAIKRHKLTLSSNLRLGAALKMVSRLHRLGWTDYLMALELRKTESRIKAYRLTLSLLKNSQDADDYATCIGCPRAKPPWARRTGWQSRKVDGMPAHVLDWICPTCFKDHGWGDHESGREAG